MTIFTSKGEEIDNTTSHKLLGVYVDQDLSFNEHVEQLCKKLTKRIGLLRSIRQYLPLNERLFFTTQLLSLYSYTAEQSGVLHQSAILGEFFVFKKEQLVLF